MTTNGLSLDNLNSTLTTRVEQSSTTAGQPYELAQTNGVYIGHPVKPYKKNKKDANGKTLKDEKGYAVKEDKVSGYQYTFFEVRTGTPIRVVFPQEANLKLGMVFAFSGKGYSFTDEQTKRVESYFYCEDVKFQQYK